MADEKRYEMLWDCSRCDTPKLLGMSHRNCPNCGSPQDQTRRYFPKDEDKVAVEDHPFVGADKACKGCDAPNAASAQFCVCCGASLEGAGPVVVRATQSDQTGGFGADSAKAATDEQRTQKLADRAAKDAPAPAPSRALPMLAGGGILAIIGLVVVLALVFVFWKKDAAVTVSSHAWSREIAVEAFKPVSDSAWKESVPAGARDVACVAAQQSTNKVPDGQDCHKERKDNGDGTFTEAQKCEPKFKDEPVMGQKCSFTVDRWVQARTASAAGTSLTPAPAWPATNIAAGEREGARTEKYTVNFTAGTKSLSCDVAQDKWANVPDGSTWKAPVGVLSGSIDCTAMQPAG